MSDGPWQINVANPSPYPRSDYVEVDLKAMGVPSCLDEGDLKLFRIDPNDDNDWEEVPYQIDHVLGNEAGNRVMTFLSRDTPAGKDDHYTMRSVRYELQPGEPSESSGDCKTGPLWVGQYYADRRGGEPEDGFSRDWDPHRRANGVKLCNDRLEFFFSLVPAPKGPSGVDYTGAITSLSLKDAEVFERAGEMLGPFDDNPKKRWGQITEIAFFPLPWEARWFSKIPMLGQRYELVWSNSGPVRATVTVRSEPFLVEYHTELVVQPSEIKLRCRLYRTISLYPGKPYFTEDVYVLTDHGKSVSFRPYYYAHLCYPDAVPTELKRFEHIPDYLAIWKHFGMHHRGLGFASDSHIRAIDISDHEPRWRLQLGHLKRCIHYCIFSSNRPADLFHDVGHYAWYEKVYKPLRVSPYESFSATRQYSYG